MPWLILAYEGFLTILWKIVPLKNNIDVVLTKNVTVTIA